MWIISNRCVDCTLFGQFSFVSFGPSLYSLSCKLGEDVFENEDSIYYIQYVQSADE